MALKKTTTERYDADGRLVERTVATEEIFNLQPIPYVVITTAPQPPIYVDPMPYRYPNYGGVPQITCGTIRANNVQ